MVRMSQYIVKQSVVIKMSELLFEILGKESNRELFTLTLSDIFSPVERLMIGKRLLVMYMLFMGVDYNVICDVVKVSRATIAKYAYLLDKSVHIKQCLATISSKKEIQKTLDKWVSSFFTPGASFGNWKNAGKFKRRLKEQESQGF